MSPTVVVVGLGPAGADLLTDGTRVLISELPVRFGRTRRHPAAPALGDATFFDDRYDAAATLDDVYAGIVEDLVAAATRHGRVLYAVPGSPAVAERTVAMLRADHRVEAEVHPALSFLDLAWVRLGIDPHEAGVTVVDGHRFEEEVTGRRGPFLVGQCDSVAVLSDIKLAYEVEPDAPPVVLWHLGLPDEAVTALAWDDLDREVHPDHLTALYLPAAGRDLGSAMAGLAELVGALRAGCPWDRRQTHASLQRYLLEETHELLEAIDRLGDDGAPVEVGDDPVDHLAEELGDVLFQVVFHSTIAAEEGWFTLADVADGVHDKLYRRHPHVFGDAVVEDLDDLSRVWEESKAAEKDRGSVMDGIPASLPALLRAVKVGRKARAVDALTATRVGLPAALSSLDPADDAAVGTLLFAVASAAADAGIDPESALRRAADRVVAEVRDAGL